MFRERSALIILQRKSFSLTLSHRALKGIDWARQVSVWSTQGELNGLTAAVRA